MSKRFKGRHAAMLFGACALVLTLAPPPSTAGEEEEAEKPRAMLLFPIMNPERGRKLFAAKGCVVCHEVNEVGGHEGPPLDFDPEGGPVNPFEIAAEMWKHAAEMIEMQKEDLGHQIVLEGDEFADLTSFLASPEEQKEFSIEDVPAEMRELLEKELEEEEEEEYGK